jgi:hypothetical protein
MRTVHTLLLPSERTTGSVGDLVWTAYSRLHSRKGNMKKKVFKALYNDIRDHCLHCLQTRAFMVGVQCCFARVKIEPKHRGDVSGRLARASAGHDSECLKLARLGLHHFPHFKARSRFFLPALVTDLCSNLRCPHPLRKAKQQRSRSLLSLFTTARRRGTSVSSSLFFENNNTRACLTATSATSAFFLHETHALRILKSSLADLKQVHFSARNALKRQRRRWCTFASRSFLS